MNQRVTKGTLGSKLVVVVATAAMMTLIVAGCGGSDEATSSGADVGSSTESAQVVSFDRAFIDGMVPHHEQAIEMAVDAKAAGLEEPVLVEIADSIISSQQGEIDRMKEWRAEWFGSAEIEPDGANGLGLDMEQMGMQSERMDFSSENDVDAAFATMMVAHHEGAIEMARLALDRGQHPEIKSLAAAIIAAQQDELDVLKRFGGGGGHDMGDMGSG